jgi:YidC/Oxa1 family membrane protein insertase
MLWVRDLSQPDALVRFSGPVSIPLIPVFDSFNVLPIVMTITWFLQSYFAPRSPDPQMQTQQKMMLFMPVVFGVMCYNLASGLSLYFLVNSLLGMAEQKVIKTFFLKPVAGSSGP